MARGALAMDAEPMSLKVDYCCASAANLAGMFCHRHTASLRDLSLMALQDVKLWNVDSVG